MRRLFAVSTIAMLSAIFVPNAHAQVINTHAITLEAAKQMAAAAEAEAAANDWNVAVAIVDAGGDLILLHRKDGTQLGSIDVAIEKARTSVRFLRPTGAFQDGVTAGNNWLLTLDILAIEGGVPVVANGEIIGAIGVSGVAPHQDTQVAEAGLAAFSY